MPKERKNGSNNTMCVSSLSLVSGREYNQNQVKLALVALMLVDLAAAEPRPLSEGIDGVFL